MKKKLNELLNVIAGTTVGVTVATILTRAADYRRYPALFEADSSPFWVQQLVPALLGLAVFAAVILLKVLLRRKKD